MKKRSKGQRQFELNLMYGSYYYIDRISDLEKALARKPRSIRINMAGTGEVPADMALLIRSVLLNRSPKTRLITNARSSLRGGSVLVWLMGEERLIRDDARVFFRRTTLPEDEDLKPGYIWKDNELKYRDSFSEIDPEEGDYARVLQLINEYLPVNELTGRLIEVPVLRQFGLVENAKADEVLAAYFGRTKNDAASMRVEKRTQRQRETSRKREIRK